MSERRHKLWVMSTEECEWERQEEKRLYGSVCCTAFGYGGRAGYINRVCFPYPYWFHYSSSCPFALLSFSLLVFSFCVAVWFCSHILVVLIDFAAFWDVYVILLWFFIFLRRRCFVFGCLFLGFCDIVAGENQWRTGDICWFLFLFSLWPLFDEYSMFFRRLAKRGCGDCGDVFVICLCWLLSVFFLCSHLWEMRSVLLCGWLWYGAVD